MSAKPFDTLIVSLKESFENINFDRQQKHENFLFKELFEYISYHVGYKG